MVDEILFVVGKEVVELLAAKEGRAAWLTLHRTTCAVVPADRKPGADGGFDAAESSDPRRVGAVDGPVEVE